MKFSVYVRIFVCEREKEEVCVCERQSRKDELKTVRAAWI